MTHPEGLPTEPGFYQVESSSFDHTNYVYVLNNGAWTIITIDKLGMIQSTEVSEVRMKSNQERYGLTRLCRLGEWGVPDVE